MSVRRLPPRKAAPTEFGSDGTVRGGAQRPRESVVGEGVVKKLAQDILDRRHGAIRFTVQLQEGKSWRGLCEENGIPARMNPSVIECVDATVGEIVEAHDFKEEGVDVKEVDRLTKANAGAIH